MAKLDTIAGIDIGSTYVRVVVGQPLDHDQMQIIGVGEAPSRGVSKGSIVDLEETVTSISEALEHAERMIGTPLSRAVVGIGGTQCKVIESQGVVAVSKPNGEVSQSDIDRADEQSQAIAASPNHDILHVLPKYYNLDHQTNIKDPLGMTGIKLEAHTQIILAASAQVKNVTKAIHRTQLELEGLVFSPLATSEVTITKRQKDLGVAMVNIGAWTTSIAVFEDSELLHAVVLPIGSDHITGDLAIGARVDVDVAERIKIDIGIVPPDKMSKRDEIDIAKYAEEGMPRHLFPKKDISEIIAARVEELLEMVNAELKKIGKAEKLPAGIVLTGGGSKMKGLIEFAKDRIKLPVFHPSSEQIFTPIDRVKDPLFTTALGLVYFVRHEEHPRSLGPSGAWFQNTVGGVIRRMRDLIS